MKYDSLKNIKNNATYYQFLEIDDDAHHEKVRFFEENKGDIKDLEFDYRIFVWCDYALSVFEIGRYQEFISLSDELIPIVVEENIYDIRGKDIYLALLFRKGASLYNIKKLDEASHIFSALCRIKKADEHKNAWKQTTHRIMKDNLRFMQALSVLFFILTAIVIGVELLIVDNWYPTYVKSFEYFRIGTFFTGILVLFLQEGIIRLKTHQMFKNL